MEAQGMGFGGKVQSLARSGISGRGRKKGASQERKKGNTSDGGMGVCSTAPVKRKLEATLVDVDVADGFVDGLAKKQKVGQDRGAQLVANTVLGTDDFQFIDPVGIAGGLVVYWKKELKVSLVRRSSFFIELLISDEVTSCDWHLINLYASTNDRIRKAQWEELLEYRRRSSGEWIIWGDFNDILWEDEKQGGRRREAWTLRTFRHFISELGVVDMGFSGYPFTWVNRRFGEGLIKERLDRVLVSSNWKIMYDQAIVRHLTTVGSDHAALLLDTAPALAHGYRQFKFDSRWCTDPESYEVIKQGWQCSLRGSKMFEVFHKIKHCRKELRAWSKQKGFNARKKITEIQHQLELIKTGQCSGESELVRSLENELGTTWAQEETFWRQKARADWMANGDRNTSFFHAKVNKRRRRNRITGIHRSDGTWCEEPDGIAHEFVAYFQNIFQTEGTSNVEEVIGAIQGKVTDHMNATLIKEKVSLVYFV
ncbi:hypothetical protein Vadar_003022 [Vaccinium darrowii]|uniref:Uncharacterized protein n=1 Tax=Vaccinium darrowii TaxID=229202 RepID=A0ACB7XW83_9ERIC|nr:hypothetical protein Vadar_003022 [Vaccinium darrowii]